MTIDELVIRRPDDMHLHLRDGDMMRLVTPESARLFGRAIIMPNLVPPIATVDMARAYRERILASTGGSGPFEPLMTLYLTEDMSPQEIILGHESGLIRAVKLYPAGATTNSASGVRDIGRVMDVLQAMECCGMPLLVHGEVTDPDIDIFDREKVFIDRVLDPLRRSLPGLRVVMEHVTTRDGVDYVRSADDGLYATLTVHHLILNRNAMLVGGIRPHFYCLPILKREEHRKALRDAATSGDRRFFLGTDSAPHAVHTKENACGCAGVYTATNALAHLAHVFEDENALSRLEAFTSLNGPVFYGLQPHTGRIRLNRYPRPVNIPAELGSGDVRVHVFDPGMPVYWHAEPLA
ncbi:MAG: dihydroorotase [Geminicoccaceae bacterium]